MTNGIYLDRFIGLVKRYEYYGEEPGAQTAWIQQQLSLLEMDPVNPTEEEWTEARSQARDEYLVILLVRHSDQERYGGLIVDLQNNHTRGTVQYPTTINKGYDLLVNHRVTHQSS